MRGPVEPVRPSASARSVLVVVATVFGLVLLLFASGAGERPGRPPRPASTSPSTAGLPGGILVYTTPAGEGASRMWRWDLAEEVVRRGPLIPRPLELTTIASPGYGWIGLTVSVGAGGQEAATLDDLGARARAERIGAADLVAWTRGGGSVVLVDHGSVSGRCRRHIRVTVVHVDVDGSEVVLNDPVCGELQAIGRTSLGYFAGLDGPDGTDVVGLGYQDAGVLLEGHALLGISPGGEMLVSAASGGSALAYEQFRGAPVPYVSRGVPFGIDRVLAYGPGSAEALVIGHAGGGGRGLWTIPLRHEGRPSIEPTRLGDVDGPTWAAYASDGTAFVLVGTRLSIVRDARLVAIAPPPAAPAPRGPFVWIVREPLTEL